MIKRSIIATIIMLTIRNKPKKAMQDHMNELV